jgi:GH24 family phage-related lysozyme (muramidase)
MTAYLHTHKKNNFLKVVMFLFSIVFLCIAYNSNRKIDKKLERINQQNSIIINAKDMIKKYEGKSILTPNDKKELGYYSQYCYVKHIEKFNNKFFVRISEQDAEECLSEELLIIEKQVNKIGLSHLSGKMKSSLISLIYNTGLTRFMKSNLYSLLKTNNTDNTRIIYEWINISCVKDKSGKYIKNDGLLKRRAEEVNHFTVFQII